MNTPKHLFIPSLPGLYDHQNEAVSGGINELGIADRCKILMACGTGKTRVGPALVVARGARTVVVYMPSLALIKQSLSEWMMVPTPERISYLCVCSDKTVAPDEPSINKEEIESEYGTVVTTDSELVRQFLLRTAKDVRVIFSTYQSSDVVRDGCPEGFTFDLGLFDEAHRTAGKGEGMFTAPLFDSHTPIAKRVFMTATPKHYNYRKRYKDGEARLDFSMDDETVYGRVAYNLPIRRAIEREIIAGYKVIISVIDDKMLNREYINGQINADGNQFNAEQIAHAIAVRNAMCKFGARKVVTFHNTVAEAAEFAENPSVKKELGCSTFHVNGSQTSYMRSEKLGAFASAPNALVTNARCLIEGVDVPEIDMVAFLHPKKSRIDIIQAIGRALRRPRGGNKTTGYILLPLYVSEIENNQFEEALRQYGYDVIWQVIEALREQDEVVNQQIFEATGAKATGKPVNLEHIEVMGPAVCLDLLRSSISTMCVEALGESWDEMYWILEQIWREEGNYKVHSKLVIGGQNIGIWAHHQRSLYKTGKLSPDRVARLESIGFVWDQLNTQWEKNFLILTRIARKTGNTNITSHLVVDGKKIGQWVSQQRSFYKTGKLSPDRVAQLESIGFVWDQLNTQWEKNFLILTCIARETGNANISSHLVVDGKKIGQWVISQRAAYKHGKMDPDSIAKLESIGFIWNQGRWSGSWDSKFALLSRIARETGNANPPIRLVVDGEKIGKWVAHQRESYNKGTISQERIAALEAIGFKWNPK